MNMIDGSIVFKHLHFLMNDGTQVKGQTFEANAVASSTRVNNALYTQALAGCVQLVRGLVTRTDCLHDIANSQLLPTHRQRHNMILKS